MRVLSDGEQEDRKRTLLQAVIHHFIKTAKPVGSAVLADEYKIDLSPATIRNVLSELENEGFLTHPHTSAGRVPTDKAYRFYVDSLMELQRLAKLEEDRIRTEYAQRVREIEELMTSTSKTLSVLSHNCGFAIAPPMEQSRIRHVELVGLDAHRILAILVADSGMVKHRVVTFEEGYSVELLPALSKLLKDEFRGKSMHEARGSILDNIENLAQRQIDVMGLAKRVIMDEAFEMDPGAEVFLEGTSNILSAPDMEDHEEMRSLVHLLNEKRALGEVLSRDMAGGGDQTRWPGLKVKIGAEIAAPHMKNFSLISSTYTIQGKTVGVLGIIGPKRMEYSRMMSLVGYMSKVVSEALNRLSGSKKEINGL